MIVALYFSARSGKHEGVLREECGIVFRESLA
jgi:hypothetical protein